MTESNPRSRTPRLLGLVALAVLALAFTVALFGSLRSARWKDAERKADLIAPHLDGLDETFDRARRLLLRRDLALVQLEGEAELSPEWAAMRGLSDKVEALPHPPRPQGGEGRVPSGAEVRALERWLDLGYRRLAAARDIEARLPALEREAEALEAAARRELQAAGADRAP